MATIVRKRQAQEGRGLNQCLRDPPLSRVNDLDALFPKPAIDSHDAAGIGRYRHGQGHGAERDGGAGGIEAGPGRDAVFVLGRSRAPEVNQGEDR